MVQTEIDIVYLWVDGDDRDWKEKRMKTYSAHKDEDMLDQYANVDGRFRNNSELLYSLRSLEKYYPECGNIYIVTDHQVPDFLEKNDKIHFIFHDEFMREDQLPTFSSKNIEASLVDIPGVSDTFLYLNDDVFFWPRFSIDDFLVNGIPQYFFVKNLSAPAGFPLPLEKVLKKYYPDYQITSEYSAHSPKIIVKKDFLDMKEEFGELFAVTQKEAFRTQEGVSLLADFFPRWMVYHGRGINAGEKGEYYRTSENFYEDMITNFPESHFFCINDTQDNDDKSFPSLQWIKEILHRVLPEKSSFEK